MNEKLKQIRGELHSYREKVAGLELELNRYQENPDWTNEFKERKRREADQKIAEAGTSTYNKIAPVIGELQNKLLDSDKSIDFINDPLLINAMRVFEACGQNPPGELTEQLAEHFKNQPLALQTLIHLCTEKNLPHEDIATKYDELMTGRRELIHQADDSIYYALQDNDLETAFLTVDRLSRALDIDTVAEES